MAELVRWCCSCGAWNAETLAPSQVDEAELRAEARKYGFDLEEHFIYASCSLCKRRVKITFLGKPPDNRVTFLDKRKKYDA